MIFDGLSLKSKRNKKLEFGPSGGGKSTLVDIIMGLLPPDAGDLMVDGQVVEKNEIKVWRNVISHIPQNIHLFDGSILDNIVLGSDPSMINKDSIEEILAIAQLKSLVSELPEGLNTRVGENGLMISGGQRRV